MYEKIRINIKRFLLLSFLFLNFLGIAYAQQNTQPMTYDEYEKLLPTLIFGGGLNFGLYRETDYKQKLIGIELYTGLPIDRRVSAEVYFTFDFHITNQDTYNFWKNYFELSNRYDFSLASFRVMGAGGRFRILTFKSWEWFVGGGIGSFGYTPIVDGRVYSRIIFNSFEALVGTGYVFNIGKKNQMFLRLYYKNYFIDSIQHHEQALLANIGITYNWFYKGVK